MMGVMKLILIFSLCACALILCSFMFLPSAPTWLMHLLHISRAWVAHLQATFFTPPLFLLLLNLVLGTLLLINSGFFKGHDTPTEKKASTSAGAGAGTMRSTSTTRILPPKPAIQNSAVRKQHLPRSKSEKLPAMAAHVQVPVPAPALPIGASKKKSSGSESADFQAGQSTRKKKKRGSSSAGAVDQGERAHGDIASSKKASTTPTTPAHGDAGDDDNEVDRRAEDFIGKFYLQMKIQRLESLQRYNQRMDRSYGR